MRGRHVGIAEEGAGEQGEGMPSDSVYARMIAGKSVESGRIRHLRSVLARGLSLRCPRCGAAPLFRGLFSMYEDCLSCDLRFEREQGYFVGAIYINYAVTVVIAIAGYFALDHFIGLSPAYQLILWGSFAVWFPLVFFRYSRSLWLSLDYIFNPESPRGERHRGPRG
ncbi:MAG: DUF983 domain-containing protein [Candidatus Methylomirabilales bacterium]